MKTKLGLIFLAQSAAVMSAAISSQASAAEITSSQANEISTPTPIVPPGDILPILSGGSLEAREEAHAAPPGSGTGHGLDEHPHAARSEDGTETENLKVFPTTGFQPSHYGGPHHIEPNGH